jgi:hypothetical protein
VPVSTYWATVEVEWLDGRTENYQVGGYARRHEAIRTTDGVLSLWMGNNAYLGPAIDQTPRSEWICGPECPQEA